MPAKYVILTDVPRYRIAALERLADNFDGAASVVDAALSSSGVDMKIEAGPDVLPSILDAAIELDFEARLA